MKVNENTLKWADVIFAMEKKHKQRLLENFREVLSNKPVVVLDIEDNYGLMDEELVQILQHALAEYL